MSSTVPRDEQAKDLLELMSLLAREQQQKNDALSELADLRRRLDDETERADQAYGAAERLRCSRCCSVRHRRGHADRRRDRAERGRRSVLGDVAAQDRSAWRFGVRRAEGDTGMTRKTRVTVDPVNAVGEVDGAATLVEALEAYFGAVRRHQQNPKRSGESGGVAK